MISDKVKTFLFSIVLYAATIAVTLVAAWRHVVSLVSASAIAPLDLTWGNGITFVLVFVVFTTVMVKFVRTAHISLGVFLLIALVAGSQFIFSAWLPWPYSLVAGFVVALLMWLVPRVLVHDLAIMLGIGGIAALLGLSITPLVAAVMLTLLSLYDIISVYRTRHMVVLAGRMLESGSVFGFLVPSRLSGFFMLRKEALHTRSVMMLGSGDIGLPLVMAASAVSQSIAASLMISGFSLIGVSLMHWLFAHQKKPAPMAALPPIAVSAILGYALAIALGI